MIQQALPGLEVPVNLDRRNAFARVPFANYFGIDEEAFGLVTPEAYAQSDPEIVRPQLYRRSERSMWCPDEGIGHVLLNAAEYTVVLDSPRALANRVQARNAAGIGGIVRSQEDRMGAARCAGAHALEKRVKPMENLITGYQMRLSNIRRLIERIPHHWMAQTSEGNMREIAESTRGGMIDTMQTLADVNGWSNDETRLALLGLDKRLMAGRGQKRMGEKKYAWLQLSKTVGNHTRAKFYLTQNRLRRTQAEIGERLGDQA